MATYRVIRFYFNGGRKYVRGLRGLSLAEAQRHCKNLQTSSRTATSRKGRERTRIYGPWFDGYEQEKSSRSRTR